MKTFKVIYHNGEGKRVFKINADDEKMAYSCFRKVFGPKIKVIGIVKVVPDKKKIQRRKRTTFIISVLVVTFILGIITGCIISNRPQPIGFDKYSVKSGDTVWGIARLSNGWNNIDGSYIVEDIMSASNCTELIHPGQVVYIPVYSN